MPELPKLHKNYSSGAIIWGSDHPTEEKILLLKNNAMYNYTPVKGGKGKQEIILCFVVVTFSLCAREAIFNANNSSPGLKQVKIAWQDNIYFISKL